MPDTLSAMLIFFIRNLTKLSSNINLIISLRKKTHLFNNLVSLWEKTFWKAIRQLKLADGSYSYYTKYLQIVTLLSSEAVCSIQESYLWH